VAFPGPRVALPMQEPRTVRRGNSYGRALIGEAIRILARTVEPVTVRSLDAIHLATALHYPSGLTSFVTYNKRLLDAAQAAALPVDSPGCSQPAAPTGAGQRPGTTVRFLI
jgi:hypothetical protein